MKNKKKALSLIAALILTLLMCACSKETKIPAKLTSETAITEQVEHIEEPTAETSEDNKEKYDGEPAVSGIRPEFKEAMDSYESFYDEYLNFLAEYEKNPTDISLLAKYAGMLSKAEEMDKKFEAWDENEMSDEELKYYLEVTARIQSKMVDIF